MLAGNIIFPALATAYAPPFFPLVVVVTIVVEVSSVIRIESDAKRKLVWLTVGAANIWSWIVGIVVTESPLFPSGFMIEDGRVTQGPYWSILALASYPLAWALSIGLELGVVYPLRRRLGVVRPFRAMLIANTCSYGAIAAFMAAGALITKFL